MYVVDAQGVAVVPHIHKHGFVGRTVGHFYQSTVHNAISAEYGKSELMRTIDGAADVKTIVAVVVGKIHRM